MRRAAKMRLALAGASGSGKTYSALLIAYGMTGDWSRIAVIDSENCSADLYAHLGGYQVLTLENYAPKTYIEAIGICEQAGAEVIIIDSISHCWDYLLDFHANLQGNSFANWAKVTPRQNAFIQRILTSSCHVICTMRSKQDYVLLDKNGKMVSEKVGLKAVQRDNVDYEFTAVLDIAKNHKATTSKDWDCSRGVPNFLLRLLSVRPSSNGVIFRIRVFNLKLLTTMYPAFRLNPEFAVGLNSDSPFLDNPAVEETMTVEEQPAQPATTDVVVSLGVRHNRHFIEANTKPVDIAHLRNDCVVPVFSKDNEVTISHQSFIETVLGTAHRMFPQEVIDAPDIVVSHIIKGRIPELSTNP